MLDFLTPHRTRASSTTYCRPVGLIASSTTVDLLADFNFTVENLL